MKKKSDFMDEYEKAFKKEFIASLFLCGEQDKKFFSLPPKKRRMDDFVRLGCISMIYGFRRVFLHIAAVAEKREDEFLQAIDRAETDFPCIKRWVEEFIDRVPDEKARALTREEWENIITEVPPENFTLTKVIHRGEHSSPQQ